MKKSLFLVLSCLIALSFSTVAYAGPYISGNIGVAILEDSDVTDSIIPPGVSVETEFDNGLALGVAAGYGFDNNFRLEAEITYQENDFDEASISISGLGSADLDLSGHASCVAFLVNLYYDFKNNSRFTPFISAGGGIAEVEINNLGVPVSGVSGIDEDETVWAYQLSGGVAYAVSNNVLIDCKYRYFETEDPEFDTTKTEYSSHNIYLGLRIAF